jgi:hypothetical protein
MEEVLDIYARPLDPTRPLVCYDESHKEQAKEVRPVVPAAPGQPERFDHEYERNGMSTLLMGFAPLLNWRHVQVTEARGGLEFAEYMRDLVDKQFPDAVCIDVVLDNLNIHSKASLYAHFAPAEAHRIAAKLAFHYTPKHGSWLNMAEIELSALRTQCLDRRIADRATLEQQVTIWEDERNAAQATIRWQFTTADARVKLEHLYPCIEHDK